jgi:hypothetical protein
MVNSPFSIDTFSLSRSRSAVAWIETRGDVLSKPLLTLLTERGGVKHVAQSLITLTPAAGDALLNVHAPRRAVTPPAVLWLAAGRALASLVAARGAAAAAAAGGSEQEDDDVLMLLAVTCFKRVGAPAAPLERLTMARHLVRLALRNDERAPRELKNAQVMSNDRNRID